MVEDFVKRLRYLANDNDTHAKIKTMVKAADLIKVLDRRNKRLEIALRKIVQTPPFGNPQEIARAALVEEKKNG